MNTPLVFKIEQIAICPANPEAAMELLEAIGATDWAKDHVVAKGSIGGITGQTNEANLAFCYSLVAGKEFELLEYTKGLNWMDTPERANSVSHLGMHVTEEELEAWRDFFKTRGVGIVQEVLTQSHTNPVIAGKRSYEYVIFDTKSVLGTDLKFIRRIDKVVITVACLVCGDRFDAAKETFIGHAWCSVCNDTTNHTEVAI